MKASKKKAATAWTLTVMLACNLLPVTVMGASVETKVEVSQCAIKDKVLTFTGKLTVAEHKPVTVMARKASDPSVIKYMRILTTDETGAFSGNVEIYDTEKTAECFDMEVLFQADEGALMVCGDKKDENGEQDENDYLVYFNDTYKKDSVENGLKKSSNVMEYMNKTENVSVYTNLGVRLDVYNQQSNEIKDAIDQAVLTQQSNFTADNGNGKDNIAEIVNGSIYAILANNANAKDMEKIITDFDANSKTVILPTNDLPNNVGDSYYNKLDSTKKSWIAENLHQNMTGDFTNYLDFYRAIRASMFLEHANCCDYMELSYLILENTDVLQDPMIELKNQTDTEIIDAAMVAVKLQAATTPFTDVKTFVDAVKDALETDSTSGGGASNPSVIPGTGTGAGSFGGGGGGASLIQGSNPGQTTAENEVFSDLAEYGWAAEAIKELVEADVVSGTGNGKFEPGREITREEFVKLICEAFGFDSNGATVQFEDVKSNDWFAPYIAAAVERKIILGISDTLFGTGVQITREDMAVIIYRAVMAAGRQLSGDGINFADENDASEYAKKPIRILADNGIINGIGDDRFAPKRNAYRAEAAVIIHRCVKKFML